MSTWLVVGVAATVVVAMRAVFVVGGRRVRIPTSFDALSGFVAPAMTAALLVPRVLDGGAVGGLGPDALALAVAVPVAARTRSIAWTLAVGMPTIWVARVLW